MGVPNDIEMNRLGRSRSPADGSTFTAHGGPTSISSAGTGTTPHPSSGRATAGAIPTGSDKGVQARVGRFLDSFRREDGASSIHNGSSFSLHVTDTNDHHHDGNGFRPPSSRSATRDHQGARYYDLRSANTKTASTLLARELKGRHLQMIAISGSIGTGLFVASGRALSQGGPASVLLAYLIVGVMLWCTMQALGEMAVVFPVAGSFSAFSTRFLDPSWGFAMGWK